MFFSGVRDRFLTTQSSIRDGTAYVSPKPISTWHIQGPFKWGFSEYYQNCQPLKKVRNDSIVHHSTFSKPLDRRFLSCIYNILHLRSRSPRAQMECLREWASLQTVTSHRQNSWPRGSLRNKSSRALPFDFFFLL
jgi:hypothetical protein